MTPTPRPKSPATARYFVTGGATAEGEIVTGPARLRGESVKVTRPDGRAVTLPAKYLRIVAETAPDAAPTCRAALAPFAAYAALYAEDRADDAIVLRYTTVAATHTLTVGDFRRAALALDAETRAAADAPALDEERHAFLCDVATTFAESANYSWWQLRGYRWFQPRLSGGSAPPVKLGERLLPNVVGELRAEDELHEGKWTAWTPFGPGLVARGFAVLAAGKVKHLHESVRGRLLGAYMTNDAGAIDAPDADIVLQCAVLGSVVYG